VDKQGSFGDLQGSFGCIYIGLFYGWGHDEQESWNEVHVGRALLGIYRAVVGKYRALLRPGT